MYLVDSTADTGSVLRRAQCASRWAPLTAVLLVAAIVRLGFILMTPVPDASTLTWDEANYHEAAIRLLEDGYFAYGSGPIGSHPNAYTMPGYTIFVAGIYSLFEPHPDRILALRVTQALLSTLTVLLVYSIGAALGGKRAGLLGALLSGLYPPFVFANLQLMTEPLYAFLLAAVIRLSIWCLQARRTRSFIAMAFSAGISALVRPAGVLLAGAPIGALAFDAKDKPALVALLRCASVVALGVTLVLAPWIVRNYLHYDRIVVFNTSTANPLLAAATWGSETPKHAAVWPTSVSDDEFELNRAWRAEAVGLIAEKLRRDPFGLVSERTEMLWEAASRPHALLFCEGQPMTGWQIWFNRSIRAFHLALLGLSISAVIQGRRNRAMVLVAGQLAYLLLTYLTVLPLARYAFPSMGPVCALAGVGALMLFDRRPSMRPTCRPCP